MKRYLPRIVLFALVMAGCAHALAYRAVVSFSVGGFSEVAPEAEVSGSFVVELDDANGELKQIVSVSFSIMATLSSCLSWDSANIATTI